MTEQFLRFAQLNNTSLANDRDAVRDEADNAQIVRDEQIRQTAALLETVEQVEHLSADRNIQRRDWLIGNDKFRLHDQRTRNADALTLSTGKLVRKAGSKLR